MSEHRPDLLLLSLGTTHGLRIGARWFATLAERSGVRVAVADTRIGALAPLRRFYPATDLVEAVAARRALATALARHRPRAVVFSTTTAALLAPRLPVPYAVWLDAPAILNRPGARNAVLHHLERRRLAAARLVLPMSPAGAAALPSGAAPAVLLPVPVLPSLDIGAPRERLAVAYTPDPKAKGLDRLCAAWAQAAVPDAELAVFGIDPDRAPRFLAERDVPVPPGVRWRGMTPPAAFRAALRRARTFVTAARWEDFGQAQLEALADGALLTCSPAPGPFAALALARDLDPGLVAPDDTIAALAATLRRAFARDEVWCATYRAAAATRLAAYHPDAVAATLARDVLPVLLSGLA